MGLAPTGIVDVDPVLRLFGNERDKARSHFKLFVGTQCDEDEGNYSAVENDILGSQEFVDEAIHRLGETDLRDSILRKNEPPLDASMLIAAVEAVLQIPASEFCSKQKSPRAVMAKGLFILIARDLGAKLSELSEITGLDTSGVSRRYEAARSAVLSDAKFHFAKQQIDKTYANFAEAQT